MATMQSVWNYTPRPVPYSGAVDADGHVLEPADLWEQYLERAYVARGIRITTDDAGLEVLEVDGHPSRVPPGWISRLGSMGKDVDIPLSSDYRYMENMPFGAGLDPGERIALLEMENIERAVLYPTLALIWEAEVADPELTYALARAYNRWIADFCRDSGGRLVPIAHLPLLDIDRAIAEFDRAIGDGCRGVFVTPFTRSHRSHGHPDHDGLWARVAAAGTPVTVHPAADLPEFEQLVRYEDAAQYHWYTNSMMTQSVVQTFAAFLVSGVFDRFPTLTAGILESGAGWLPTMLARMDMVLATEHTYFRQPPMREKPSECFRRSWFIAAEPDEATFARNIDFVGADRVVWASDYPHSDHPPTYTTDLPVLVGGLADHERQLVLGQNVVDLYGLAPLS